jgi:hypothetical protein
MMSLHRSKSSIRRARKPTNPFQHHRMGAINYTILHHLTKNLPFRQASTHTSGVHEGINPHK